MSRWPKHKGNKESLRLQTPSENEKEKMSKATYALSEVKISRARKNEPISGKPGQRGGVRANSERGRNRETEQDRNREKQNKEKSRVKRLVYVSM